MKTMIALVVLSATASLPCMVTARAEATPAVPVQGSVEDGVYVVDQDLPALLTEFCRRIGVVPDLSKQVKGEVKNAFLPADRTRFLQQVGQRYGLEWYFEGTNLHISTQQETVSRLIDIKSLSMDDINAQIAQADIDPNRFPARSIPQGNAVMVTAPPSYLARVEVIVDAILKAQPGAAIAGVVVIKFGHKAWVANATSKPDETK
jgi:type II secretory pathway component GspD/PulD (secretin)